MEFCKAFNASTESLEKNMPIPVVITVFYDKSFSFVTKTPPVSFYLKKAAGKEKGSSEPGRTVGGSVKINQIKEIADNKMKDLNAADINGAIEMVKGSSHKFKDLLSIILYISIKLLLFFITYSTTSKPIDLAEHLTISIAPLISAAFKSFILFSAISLT